MKLILLFSSLFIISFLILIEDVSCLLSPSAPSIGTPEPLRGFREDFINTDTVFHANDYSSDREFRTGRAIDPRLYDLPSTSAPIQPAPNTNLERNDNSFEDPLTDGNWFEMLVAFPPLPHN